MTPCSYIYIVPGSMLYRIVGPHNRIILVIVCLYLSNPFQSRVDRKRSAQIQPLMCEEGRAEPRILRRRRVEKGAVEGRRWQCGRTLPPPGVVQQVAGLNSYALSFMSPKGRLRSSSTPSPSSWTI